MLLLVLCTAGCGGHDDGTPVVVITLSAPIVTVTATPPTATTTQALSVVVTVGSGPVAAAGTVVLTSGAYRSAPTTLSGGSATIAVPSGVLPAGSDLLTATYVPSTSAAATDLASTGTTTVTVAAATLPSVVALSTNVPTYGHPFQALPVGNSLFVSVSSNGTIGSATGIRVYDATSPAQPAFRCFQPLAYADTSGTAVALGLAASAVGDALAVAVDNAGLALLNVSTTAANCSGTGTLVSQGALTSGQGSFGVAITPDGNYAFVANEYGAVGHDTSGAVIAGNVGVVVLAHDATGRVSGGTLVGQFSTGGQAIANVTLSPDGSRLYVTSEIARTGVTVSGTGNPLLAHGGCLQSADDTSVGSTASTYGLLTVVDVVKAEAAPGPAAIVATVAAGCSPVRVVEAADQNVIWVAARGDNRVLAFSTHQLEVAPDNALIGYGDTGGVAPAGLLLFHGQQLLAVANSNRFASPASAGNMTILSAVPVGPTVLRTVPAFLFPRSLGVAADDATVYLTDYDSATVQVIRVSTS